MAIAFILLLLGAYLLGSVPAAYLTAKWSRRIDIRQYGSGNVGAANVFEMTSRRWAIPVIVFDLFKGMVVVYIAKLIGLEVYQQVIIGIAAIVGHNWPVFLRFSGGRGVLTTLGVALLLPLINGPLIPWAVVVGLPTVGIILLFTHNTPLGVGVGVATMPLVSWIAGEPLPMTWGFLAMFLIMVIRRLTAPKTSLSATVSTGELVLNRLLLDRDVRDKDVWLSRQPIKQGEKKEGMTPTK